MFIIMRLARFALLLAGFVACDSAQANDHEIGLAGVPALNAGELQALKGGEEPVALNLASSSATNTSTVSGNSIGNIGGTGGISSSALSGNSGLTTLIANSGNQVTISQSTIVNVFLH